MAKPKTRKEPITVDMLKAMWTRSIPDSGQVIGNVSDRCDELIKLKCSDITINAESMLMWPPVRQISTGRDPSLLWDSDKDLSSENVGKIFCNGWFISYITWEGVYGISRSKAGLKLRKGEQGEGLRARKRR